MSSLTTPHPLAELRERVRRLEGGDRRARDALPFGVGAIDQRLPGGGLALGSLHEVAGGGNGSVDGAAAALFAAGVAARTKGPVLWCVVRQDLFAPALQQAGLMPGRVIFVEAGSERELLGCFEDGLRHGGIGAVVAEVAKLSMTASRRLQLAAEGSGTMALAIRRWRRQTEAADFGQPTAAATRWVAIFGGDVMHHPLELYDPELVSSFCEFPDAARRSRMSLLERAADVDAIFFTAHFARSSFGRVSRRGGGFEWAFIED